MTIISVIIVILW